MVGGAQESNDAVRILLVDDDEDDYEVTRGIVSQIRSFRGEIRWEKTYDSGLAALRRRQGDVCLLDYRLGARTGLELLTDARQSGCEVPVIFLTGKGEQQTDDLAMKCGADDYLEKSELTATVLERSVRYALERARHLEELRRSEQRYRRIVETTNQGVWVIDAQARTTFVNARMASMLGYDRNEVAGAAMLDFVDEEWRDAAVRDIGYGRELPIQAESKLKRKDGASVAVLLELAPMFGESGSYEGSFAMVMDVTDRRNSEKALRRVQTDLLERMRVTTLTAEVGVALTADDTLRGILARICQTIANDLGAAFGGVWLRDTATDAIEFQAKAGTCTHVAGSDSDVPVEQFKLSSIVEERRPYLTNDVQNDPRGADSDWWRREGIRAYAAYPLLVGGESLGVMVVLAREPLTDVVLSGLASIADAIAIRVRGKLAEQAKRVLEGQLLQLQKMEAVGRLAGGVAHDFNNILSVVLSYCDLLIEDLKEGDPIREDVEQIRRAGVRAADLTRQLLMFSRQQVIEPKVLNLNEVLSGMDKMLQRLVGEDVELVSIPGVSLARVCMDPGSVEQVIMNLVVNARDAMPTGGQITIETADMLLDEEYVKSHLGAKPGTYVMLSVTDTGTGMDKATMAQIFEPFFTTKEKGKGTGLGLSTVFGIVRQSGGNIWVYSEPGVGTTFKVYLPRVDAQAKGTRPSTRPVTLRGSETVLLVEDEEQVRDVARGILQRHGYTVIVARTGEEALVLCERHPGTIHLLLTDVVMPRMSGPKLAQGLVRMRPEMRVLCMSGYTDDAAVRHGVIDAELAYLQKPITVENLTRKVREVLDRRPEA